MWICLESSCLGPLVIPVCGYLFPSSDSGNFQPQFHQIDFQSPSLPLVLLHACMLSCDPTDCSSPSSSIHGILQARILQWVAMPSSWGSSQSEDWTHVSCISSPCRRSLYHCTIWLLYRKGWYAWWCLRVPLNCSHFLNVSFFPCFKWAISIILSFRSLIHSSVSPNLLIPSSMFFFSVTVFFISDWFFYLHCLVPCYNSHYGDLFFFQIQLAFLLPMLWTFYLIKCLFLFH